MKNHKFNGRRMNGGRIQRDNISSPYGVMDLESCDTRKCNDIGHAIKVMVGQNRKCGIRKYAAFYRDKNSFIML